MKPILVAQITEPMRAAFCRRVRKGDGCWEWTKSPASRGYGHFVWENRRLSAHRVAYVMAHGEIPAGMFVCHHCDNRRCVRPDHLFAGYPRDNTRDMWHKGRNGRAAKPEAFADIGRKGERNSRAKLTERDVRTIRALKAAGISGQRLADFYGVNRATINDAAAGRKWKCARNGEVDRATVVAILAPEIGPLRSAGIKEIA